MSHRLIAAAALAALVGLPAAASAQTAVIVTEPQAVVAAPQGYVVVNPDQTAYIQRYVVDHPAPRASFTTTYRPAVGTELPSGVAVQTFAPGSYGGFEAQRYGYILTDTDQTVLVDPTTRRVIQVLP
ncbi:DUF1236 domain-containing protein [Azorhizobium doebereinerae]|uniref:DUF1236 domain-containing protein n=1 Tax=Azorhizobium doebereinerae TaxID=281091 RepID=UPI0003FCB8C4|nr:DUF1236 domain-containing protein [Azorhizobium doebereinerae]